MSEINKEEVLAAKYLCRNCKSQFFNTANKAPSMDTHNTGIKLRDQQHYALTTTAHSCIDGETGMADLIGFRWI